MKNTSGSIVKKASHITKNNKKVVIKKDKTKSVIEDIKKDSDVNGSNELKQQLKQIMKELNHVESNPEVETKDAFNNSKFDYYTNTFDVIDTILHQNNKRELANHQLTSYKQFIEKDLGDIIRQFNTRKIYFGYDANANKHKMELHIDFLNYNLGRPTINENDGSSKVMRPDIAKLRNLTYNSFK